MYCENCGAKLPDDGIFCEECGAKQEFLKQILTGKGNRKPFVPDAFVEDIPLTPEEKATVKKYSIYAGIGAGVLVAILVIVAILSSVIKPSIKLNKYLTITTEGYNTIGVAEVSLDYDAFIDAYGKKLLQATSDEFGKDAMPEDVAYIFLDRYVDGYLDKDTNLSNGDTINYIWNCDAPSALSDFGYKLVFEDVEFPVENLKEAKTFDPFEGIEVTFEGISPDGSAYISSQSTSIAANDMYFNLDKSYGLSNGDTVTVSYSGHGDDRYFIDRYGMIPDAKTKVFTVTGLDSYITSLSQISDTALQQMKDQCEDIFYARRAKSWASDIELNAFTYLGNYLLVNKDYYSFGGNRNRVYMVYQVTVTNRFTNSQSESFEKTSDYYWFVAFEDLLVDDAGEVTLDIGNYSNCTESFEIDSGIKDGWYSRRWQYEGYTTLEELYNAVVTCNREAYTNEDSMT